MAFPKVQLESESNVRLLINAVAAFLAAVAFNSNE